MPRSARVFAMAFASPVFVALIRPARNSDRISSSSLRISGGSTSEKLCRVRRGRFVSTSSSKPNVAMPPPHTVSLRIGVRVSTAVFFGFNRPPLAHWARLIRPVQLGYVGPFAADAAAAFSADVGSEILARRADGVPIGHLLVGAAGSTGGDVRHRGLSEVAHPLEQRGGLAASTRGPAGIDLRRCKEPGFQIGSAVL